MRQGTIITVAPTQPALALADAKRQLQIDDADTSQDVHVQALIASAERAIERELGYPIMAQTRATHLTSFPCGGIWLGAGAGFTVIGVSYIDGAGAAQTLDPANYVADAISEPTAIYAAPEKTWPSTQVRPSAVVVTWTAGYANAAAVPEDMRHALRLLVGHYDQNREAVVVGTITAELPLALDSLLQGFRIPMVA